MKRNIGQDFKMKNSDIDRFFRELYIIMKKYNIHRIYTASIDKKKIISAQQLLGVPIGKTKLINKIYDILDNHIPWLFYNTIYRNYIFRYKIQLRRLFDRYSLEKIGISSFVLYQGIHITPDGLCVKKVDLIYKDGTEYHIEDICINI